MIHAMVPYALDMNLGAAYNRAMETIGEDDWACFLDHDAMWTTRDWYWQLVEVIAAVPSGTFTAVTNRIASPWQRADEANSVNDDIPTHRRIGEKRARDRRTLLDISDTKGFGGVVILLSKRNWRTVGGFVDGMGCVDHNMHFALVAAGLKTYLMEHVYVYHWRGTCGTPHEASIPKAKSCQCRGAEILPTHRIPLRTI